MLHHFQSDGLQGSETEQQFRAVSAVNMCVCIPSGQNDRMSVKKSSFTEAILVNSSSYPIKHSTQTDTVYEALFHNYTWLLSRSRGISMFPLNY